jgi:hypothetical protein
MKYKRYDLTKVRRLLRSLCHDENCATLNKCPKLCLCDERRTFKLNTETAICWLMARFIAPLCDSSRDMSELYAETIIEKMNTLIILSSFHISNHWQILFSQAAVYVSMTTVDDSFTTKPEDLLKRMKESITKLDREPKQVTLKEDRP